MLELTRYPDEAGETIIRMLGVEHLVVGFVTSEAGSRYGRVLLAKAHEMKAMQAYNGGVLSHLNKATSMVAVKWSVLDVAPLYVPKGYMVYDAIGPAVELGLRTAVEVFGADAESAKVGDVYSVTTSTPSGMMVTGLTYHGSIKVYGQRWCLDDVS